MTFSKIVLTAKRVRTYTGGHSLKEACEMLVREFFDGTMNVLIDVESPEFTGRVDGKFEYKMKGAAETLHHFISFQQEEERQKKAIQGKLKLAESRYKKLEAKVSAAQKELKALAAEYKKKSDTPSIPVQTRKTRSQSKKEKRRSISPKRNRNVISSSSFIEEDIVLPPIPQDFSSEFQEFRTAFESILNDSPWDARWYEQLWSTNAFFRHGLTLMQAIVKTAKNPNINEIYLSRWIENQYSSERWHSTMPAQHPATGICAFCNQEVVLTVALTADMNDMTQPCYGFDQKCGEKFESVSKFLTAIHHMIVDLRNQKLTIEVVWHDLILAMHEMKKFKE